MDVHMSFIGKLSDGIRQKSIVCPTVKNVKTALQRNLGFSSGITESIPAPPIN